jgi:hypothetical protein
MNRKPTPAQLDLFVWADQRPSAKVISAIPGIARRIWRERAMQQPNHPGNIVPMPARLDERRRA